MQSESSGVNDAEALAISFPSEAEISQRMGPAYDAARTLNAVRMLAGAGDLAGPAIDLMQAIFKTTAVDAKTRELIILRTAKAVGCDYALRAGAVIAANTGLAAEEIAAAMGMPIPARFRPKIRCCAGSRTSFPLAAACPIRR